MPVARNAMLIEEQVREARRLHEKGVEIRELFETNHSIRALARKMDVSTDTIRRLLQGKRIKPSTLSDAEAQAVKELYEEGLKIKAELDAKYSVRAISNCLGLHIEATRNMLNYKTYIDVR